MLDKEINDRIIYNKDIIFKILKHNKVKSVTVTFDGGGDSGQVDDVEIKPSSKKVLLSEPVVGAKCLHHVEYKNGEQTPIYHSDDDSKMTFEFVLGSLCYDILERGHDGWEINDGSFGDFHFNVKDESINLVYNERYTDVRTTEENF